MSMVDPQVSRGVTAQATAQAILTLAHSLRARGGRRSAELALLAIGLPGLAEYGAIHGLTLLRHRTTPQIAGVPVLALLGWYNVTYPSFALVEGLLIDAQVRPSTRRWAVPLGTALVGTSVDLLLDGLGLDRGLWEWSSDGPYAAEIIGPNGRRGIPLLNFVGWLGLATAVSGIYLLRHPDDHAVDRPGGAGTPAATRTAALLLLPSYLGGAAWAVSRRRWRSLVYAALVPLAIGLGLARRDSR